MLAARASGPALGTTTAESAGERAAPASQPRPLAPATRSSRASWAIAGVFAVATAGASIAVLAGGSEPEPEAADPASALDAAPAIAARLDAAPPVGFAEVIRLAKSADCTAASAALDRVTDSSDVRGRGDALVARGDCELVAGRVAEATLLANRALELVPDHPGAARLAAAAAARVEDGSGSDKRVAEAPKPKPKPKPREPATRPRSVCDEVSCLVDPDQVCCAKLRPSATPPKPATAGRPDRISRNDISSVVAGVRGRIMACAEGTSFKGTVRVRIKISAEGQVVTASTSGAAPGAVASCITAAMRRARFPKAQKPTTVSYPFVF
jgi:hypothetical protein